MKKKLILIFLGIVIISNYCISLHYYGETGFLGNYSSIYCELPFLCLTFLFFKILFDNWRQILMFWGATYCVCFLFSQYITNSKDNTILDKNHYAFLSVIYDVKRCCQHNTNYYSLRLFFLNDSVPLQKRKYPISCEGFEKMKIKVSDTILVWSSTIYDFFRVKDYHPTHDTIQKYLKPVKVVDGFELGNDYYYYMKLRPKIALNNYGLNKLTLYSDSLLYYRNVNDSIDWQAYKCGYDIQTQQNYDIIRSSGYAFYFHGEIVPKEQVFEEVPPAKEYYERYCGKE